MILVALGTQDKSFHRLLEAIDREIEKGNIKDEVIVQAGFTKYESNNMKIFDLIAKDEFDKLLSTCDLLITHGGIGTILQALKEDRKVLAAARLKKYGEHLNDHQTEIIEEFVKESYILELKDFDKLGQALKDIKKFKAKKYKSNNAKMIKMLSDFMDI